MILAFNLLFWGWISAILGGLYTKPDPITGEPINKVRRYISLPACFIVLAFNTYPDLIALVAWCFVFVVIRLRSTRPLLDLTYPDLPDSRISELYTKILWRNLPIVLAVPFTNIWILLFFMQGLIYFYAAKIQRHFNLQVNAVRVAEIISGSLYGLCLQL